MLDIERYSMAGLLAVSILITATYSDPLLAQPDSPLEETGIEPNVVSYSESPDPLIRYNRAMFTFNDVAYRYALIPAENAYVKLPVSVRTGIGNFFDNLKSPIPFVNQVFQLEWRDAGTTVARFVVNSTIGIAGIFDPSTTWLEIERKESGFSDTLSRYGVGYGPYFVMPIAGPSTIREGGGFLADGFVNPLAYILDNPESLEVRAFDNFQDSNSAISAYLKMRDESQDLYVFMRELHMQGIRRDTEFE